MEVIRVCIYDTIVSYDARERQGCFMTNYFSINSDYVSTIFSSLNTNNNNTNNFMTSGIYSLTSEYASIKSGSYKKLLNAYYSDDSKKEISSSIATTADSAKKLTSIKSSADSLVDSAKALYTSGKNSMFNKIEKKDDAGNVTSEYDKDAIYKAVKAFVDDYNGVLDSTEKSNTSSIVNNVKGMITTTSTNSKLLAKIGIDINADSTLSIDREKFDKADMSTVKSLFNGNGSYGYQIGVRGSMIDKNVQNETSKSNTYSATGNYTYNYASGDMYNYWT